MQAVDADVNDAAANAALGWVALYSRKHSRSLAAYTRAMDLNPSDADILAEYADSLGHSGANEEAIPLFQRAIRLNPHMSDIYAKDLAYVYLKSRRFDEVIRTVEQMRRPQIADLSLVAALAHAGRIEEARVAAETVRRARPGFSPEAWVTMVPDRNPDDTALYLEGMKRAGL
jgi:Flp pilus assembly protein TadD